MHQTHGVDPGDAAPAGADLDHVDRRHRHREAARACESPGARHLELVGDRHRPVADEGDCGLDLLRRNRAKDVAVAVGALVDGDTQMPRDQRSRRIGPELVGRYAHVAAHLKHVTEAAGREQRRARALALDAFEQDSVHERFRPDGQVGSRAHGTEVAIRCTHSPASTNIGLCLAHSVQALAVIVGIARQADRLAGRKHRIVERALVHRFAHVDRSTRGTPLVGVILVILDSPK